MNNTIVFDIETAPAKSDDELLKQFEPKFEPNGTLKDPIKIASDLAQKRIAWLAESALHAELGKILAIGYKKKDTEIKLIHGEDEGVLLQEWIRVMGRHAKDIFAGFNILDFDLPFIRRRCFINRIVFPFYSRSDKWKPWTFPVYDAMADWASGAYKRDKGAQISLNNLSRGLGIGGKDTGIGARFSEVYRENQEEALAYLEHDVRITWEVCRRMTE